MPAAAAILAHSGGPTPVINASLLGVVERARRFPGIASLYGARFGIDGVLAEDFVDLFAQIPAALEGVARAPASALGASRRELTAPDLDRLLAIFRARNIRYFFYTGGNGSMRTAWEIAGIARQAGFDLQVIGIPKTIDNDLAETDHSPGYPSAARFFACAVRDIGADNRALPGQVEFVEVLGRDAGWIVAATAFARGGPDDAPHLVYFPEVRLPLGQLLDDIDSVYGRLGRCVVAVCEGQLDEHGEPFGADSRPGSRGQLAMNLGHRLAVLTAERLKLKTRSEKPGLLGRTCLAYPSPVDWAEARLCGQAAVEAAEAGKSAVMIALVRQPGDAYSVATACVPLERVAFAEKKLPAAWLTRPAAAMSPAFAAYAAPLVGPVDPYPELVP
ncbi:MAG TPA: diphosphate--fructose-6-phosphate 1-phosphotransferase [Bryobacteraceae bacterium]|nr:diphosphate--fructose-6-phosphate 1-phosphotransferase [Bryobacteraceae bacterium]